MQGLKLDDGTRIDVGGIFIELGAKGATSLANSDRSITFFETILITL